MMTPADAAGFEGHFRLGAEIPSVLAAKLLHHCLHKEEPQPLPPGAPQPGTSRGRHRWSRNLWAFHTVLDWKRVGLLVETKRKEGEKD